MVLLGCITKASGDAIWEYWQHWSIWQSSLDSMTYIRTRMYQSTRFASPRHILWCGRLVYWLEKLTLDKIDLENIKFFISFAQSLYIFWFWYSTINTPKLHCFELKHAEQHYTISKSNLSNQVWWRIHQTVETRVLSARNYTAILGIVSIWILSLSVLTCKNTITSYYPECNYCAVTKWSRSTQMKIYSDGEFYIFDKTKLQMCPFFYLWSCVLSKSHHYKVQGPMVSWSNTNPGVDTNTM